MHVCVERVHVSMCVRTHLRVGVSVVGGTRVRESERRCECERDCVCMFSHQKLNIFLFFF